MALFTGVHINKLDKKGRVSVPATFRAALAGLSFPGVYAYPARVARAVECCGIDWMERLNERIGMLCEGSHVEVVYFKAGTFHPA